VICFAETMFVMSPFRLPKLITRFAAGLVLLCPLAADEATDSKQLVFANADSNITLENWGSLGSPVTGTSESMEEYPGAELFAGPKKFANTGDTDYFHGVLPNGRIVKPAGDSTQVGMNPLGIVLTPDGKFLIVSNDDERKKDLERKKDFVSIQNPKNHSGYSLSVLDTSTSPMTVVSQIDTAGEFFVGLQVASNASAGYTLYVSGGGDNSIKLFSISGTGGIEVAANQDSITIPPTLPANAGWVSNFTPASTFDFSSIPSAASSTKATDFSCGFAITFPAGIILSPNGKYLYVACDGDNSLAVIDTTTNVVVAQYPVGYFPYSVSVSSDGKRVAVSNWGVTAYKFAAPSYDKHGKLTALGTTTNGRGLPNLPAGFFVPVTDTEGKTPKTSSVSFFDLPNGEPTKIVPTGAVNEGKPLDQLVQVGDTHPSATAVVSSHGQDILYVTRTNDDSLGLIDFKTGKSIKTIRLSLIDFGGPLVGTYPNALAASSDGRRLYVAEAGINSVAVLDTSDPINPKLLSRIPTGWWPSALALARDDKILYIVNAKGVGEDINPNAKASLDTPAATGVQSFTDSNFVFGTVQKVDLSTVAPGDTSVLQYNLAKIQDPVRSVVPVGGNTSSPRIKTVIFIEQENKTFDSVLGTATHFGHFASVHFNKSDGSAYTSTQYNPVAQNTQMLATTFATAVNYYSNSEESDAGHQFCASGTATDYTEKTLLVKNGRGLLVNKNFDPEDYPANGYIFNNAARHQASFKDYGELVRIDGTDTGNSTPTTIDDPSSGKEGYPSLPETNPVAEVQNSDVNSPTEGLGQAYFLDLPILAILGGKNSNGEPHLDKNYPGYNFNISDQRRALEFIRDFDQMLSNDTVPQFLYIYLPNDHTGQTVATNIPAPTAPQQVEDGDVALGMVVQRIINSPVYYNPKDNTGAAIFITYDDAQATVDHIHPHRTPLIVISPFAKPGYLGKEHYVTASIVKTEELLLGLPPNNLDDLLATDLRDLFQDQYNGIKLPPERFNRIARYEATPPGRAIWSLVKNLNTSRPDQDSRRLGVLGRLSMRADDLYKKAEKNGRLGSSAYLENQETLMHLAKTIVEARDADDRDE
jgi:YVTN family beta-propeller protein